MLEPVNCSNVSCLNTASSTNEPTKSKPQNLLVLKSKLHILTLKNHVKVNVKCLLCSTTSAISLEVVGK